MILFPVKPNPSVLIGTATIAHKGHIFDRWLDNVKKFTYDNYDLLLVDTSDGCDWFTKLIGKGMDVVKCAPSEGRITRITDACNKLRETALEGGYDYLIILDQDILPPVDFIERLTGHKKEFVSGLAKIIVNEGLVNCAWYGHFVNDASDVRRIFNDGKFKFRWLEDSMLNKGLIEWNGGIGGVPCFSANLLKKMSFISHGTYAPDSFFGNQVRELGYKVFVDTDLLCDHYPDYAKEGLLYERNIGVETKNKTKEEIK